MSLGCILGVFAERKPRFRMGKLHCVAMAAQYQQPNENTGRLYGCLGRALSISKAQQAFQEDQRSSPPRHRQENRRRKSNFGHYMRRQQAAECLCNFLPQRYAAPALSSDQHGRSCLQQQLNCSFPGTGPGGGSFSIPPWFVPDQCDRRHWLICCPGSLGRCCKPPREVCLGTSGERVAQSCLLAQGQLPPRDTALHPSPTHPGTP